VEGSVDEMAEPREHAAAQAALFNSSTLASRKLKLRSSSLTMATSAHDS
jgi:hypothetical protein